MLNVLYPFFFRVAPFKYLSIVYEMLGFRTKAEAFIAPERNQLSILRIQRQTKIELAPFTGYGGDPQLTAV